MRGGRNDSVVPLREEDEKDFGRVAWRSPLRGIGRNGVRRSATGGVQAAIPLNSRSSLRGGALTLTFHLNLRAQRARPLLSHGVKLPEPANPKDSTLLDAAFEEAEHGQSNGVRPWFVD